jgi:isopentenyldiphosphate isomerase
MDSPDEILDLVDAQDQVIGWFRREHAHGENLGRFRTVNAFIINDDGELWIPTRATTKKLFPGCLDTSVGGHVVRGASYDDTLWAETREEAGLDLTVVPWKRWVRLTPADGVTSFMWVYEIRANDVPEFSIDDIDHATWMTPGELTATIRAGTACKSDLEVIVGRLF